MKKTKPIKSNKQKSSALKETPTPERYAGVVFEDFKGLMKVFNENLQLLEKNISSNVNQRIDGLENQMNQGFLAVDARFYKVEKQIQEVWQELKEEIQEVRQELKETREELSEKIDHLGERVGHSEANIEEIKQRANL